MRDQGGKIKMSGKLKVKMCSRRGRERSCTIKRDRVTLGSQVLNLACVPELDVAKTR